MDFFLIAELVINGVFVGLMYALVSLGIVLIYKTSGLVNLAQGALAMTGAYITWMVGNYFGMPIWVSIPAAVVLMFFGGVFIERSALRRMIGQPVIMAIMLTLGIEIALRGLLPGVFGAAVKKLDIGVSPAPLFVGDILINQSIMIGGVVSLALILSSLAFFNSRYGIVMRLSQMIRRRLGRSVFAWKRRLLWPGGLPRCQRLVLVFSGAQRKVSIGPCRFC